MPRQRRRPVDNTETEGPGGTQLTHAATALSDDVADHMNWLEEEIREHPIRSLAIAVVGGILLAKLLD
jgi:hypothetical protein